MVRVIEMPALSLAFWRVVLGAIAYSAILMARGQPLRWTPLRACTPVAVLTSAWLVVFYEALKSTTIANVTMIGALLPVILLGTASRRFGEPISMRLIGLAVLAVAGTALVLVGSSSTLTWSARGDGLSVVALILWALVFALSKEIRQQVGAVEFQASVWIVGALVLGPVTAVSGGFEWPSAANWAWVTAMLAVPGTGHFLMNWSHRHVRLTVTSMITLASAPLSMIGAAVFLEEPIVAAQMVGAVVVVAALSAVIRRDTQLEARHTLRSSDSSDDP